MLNSLVKKILKAALIFIISMVGLLLGGLFLGSRSVRTISLQDVNIASCTELPNIEEIDQLFITNKENLSHFLDQLATCENNVDTCSRYGRCKKENYSKREVSSGNTFFRWDYVKECKSQGKGALYYGNTSACEIQVTQNFFNQHPEFKNLPIKSVNY